MGCINTKSHDDSEEKYKHRDNNNVAAVGQFDKIDAHARKAPRFLMNPVEDIVNHMSSFSKEPRILVRGFFVWISENIRYDVDGYFGRTSRAASDANSVMRGGSSVCEGYANVMEALCKQAEIPVKTISGYVKGYGYSAAKLYKFTDPINHAWTAVQLKNKWYLLDSTWGSGHMDSSNMFKKEFEELFFLTDPKLLISTHFPYMEDNLEESKKWQLLSKPISLEEFNKTVKYKPAAFKLGVQAVSHPNGYIEMKNELSMVFKSTTKEELILSGRLMLEDKNVLREQPNVTLGLPDKGNFKLLVHPPKVGLYKLYVFGQTASDKRTKGIPEIMEYTINCTHVNDTDFQFPMPYAAAGNEKTVLYQPTRGRLKAKETVKFKISAPFLQKVVVGEKVLDKTGNTFTGEVKCGSRGERLVVYGSRGGNRMEGLYEFTVC